MQILHISDTHSRHREIGELPAADLIIHSGDVSFAGSEEEIENFIKWFCGLNYAHKIFIAGNHDDYLYENKIDNLPINCHYLHHESIEIDGIKFWGSPLFVEEDMIGITREAVEAIPNGIDILITHQPPFGIMDKSHTINFGCHSLLAKVKESNPKFHLFGHIHDAYGQTQMGNTLFSNASILNENYEIKNKAFLFKF